MLLEEVMKQRSGVNPVPCFRQAGTLQPESQHIHCKATAHSAAYIATEQSVHLLSTCHVISMRNLQLFENVDALKAFRCWQPVPVPWQSWQLRLTSWPKAVLLTHAASAQRRRVRPIAMLGGFLAPISLCIRCSIDQCGTDH